MKTYSAKSSAIRAAKKEHGAAWETKAQIQPIDGAWQIIPAAPINDGHMSLAEALAESGETLEELMDDERVPGFTHCPSCEIHLSNGVLSHRDEYAGKWDHAEQYECMGCGAGFGPLLDDSPLPSPEKADALANRLALGWKLSSCEKPTKKVWAIASEMPGASRKEVIEACIAAGIGAGTSRTQYQAWFSAMRASGLSARG